MSSGKNELLFSTFGINYNNLPARVRKVRCGQLSLPASAVWAPSTSKLLCSHVPPLARPPGPGVPLNLAGFASCVAKGHRDKHARGRQHSGAARAARAGGAA